MEDRADAVLRFWFAGDTEARMRRWFGAASEVDAEIRERFGRDLERAAAGGYDHWQESARGTLALLILLDQLSRNIHRGDARTYDADPKALAIARAALTRGLDQQLEPHERPFVYLPLEHAEDREAQRQSVAAFERLAREHEGFEGMLDYAVKHQKVIERFGRFPHRNAVLGRESTAEELRFLSEEGIGW